MQRIAFILIALNLILYSCSSTKKSIVSARQGKIESENFTNLKSVLNNNLSNTDFQIQKADITVSQQKLSVKFLLSIKYRYPDSMLVIARSRTGLEAGRALITKDTILINDKINRKYLIGSPEYIGKKYGVDPSQIFVILGDIIVDRNDSGRSIKCIDDISQEIFTVNDRSIEYVIDCSSHKAVGATMSGDFKSGNLMFLFKEMKRTENLIYPGKIEVYDDKNSLKILIEIEKIEPQLSGRMNFVKGAGFRVIKIR